jgi:2-polyprenyl-6-methoxyphenol hydroxylase-like FAD-dependent oxidoreductase
VKVRKVAVIGGGIAGPVTALALHRAGIEATVYEAYEGRAHGLGGTIALAANGVATLEIVGVAEPTKAVGQPAFRQRMTVNGKQFDLPALADAQPHYVVRRTDLHRILHDAMAERGILTGYGKRLTTVREAGDGVTAVFADGTEATADVLVGADGVHSTVRRLIDPSAPGPRYTGMLAFEGESPVVVPVEPGTTTFAFGRHGYYLYWPAAGGGTTFGVNLPYPEPITINEARAVPRAEWMRTLLRTYGQDVPGGEILRRTDPDAIQIGGALHIMPPVPHWYRGRMVLVGDAVHAPSNSTGQGASLAIESAIQLARCLRDVDDLPAALAGYEKLRRQRVEMVAAQGAKVNSAKAPGPFVQSIMPLLMPLFFKLFLRPEKTIGPVQRYRIDWDAPVFDRV